ncbi:hypothetical protein CTI12_AA561720 [Artemisia annua]|uniref:Reverse transcriptase zinc-binding domain-containing protein n=1 Tax=Artemisia annua TaxID=35608 RepID=A0A2U1KUT7_ARTAN|nr:hypothetical protein CTI12_AA561720 [Artemisia annua]
MTCQICYRKGHNSLGCDKNTRFFHLMSRIRSNSSYISGIQIGDSWEENPEIIKHYILNHFAVPFQLHFTHKFRLIGVLLVLQAYRLTRSNFPKRLMGDASLIRTSKVSQVWRDLLSLQRSDSISEVLGPQNWAWKCGNGQLIEFWGDVWIEDFTLRNKFPELYLISNNRFGKLFGNLPKMTEDGVYSVSHGSFIMLSDPSFHVPSWARFLWNNKVPSKVQGFHWLAIQGHISVKEVLNSRGIIPSGQQVNCIWCNDATESVHHLLLHCGWSFRIWSALFRWWNVEWIIPSSLAQFSEDWNQGMGINAKKFWCFIGLFEACADIGLDMIQTLFFFNEVICCLKRRHVYQNNEEVIGFLKVIYANMLYTFNANTPYMLASLHDSLLFRFCDVRELKHVQAKGAQALPVGQRVLLLHCTYDTRLFVLFVLLDDSPTSYVDLAPGVDVMKFRWLTRTTAVVLLVYGFYDWATYKRNTKMVALKMKTDTHSTNITALHVWSNDFEMLKATLQLRISMKA